MKKLVIFGLFIISSLAFAQNQYQDVVYLKNGSIIRGIIMEQIPNKSIKIETADRSLFVFQMDEIEKFAKEPFLNQRNTSNSKGGFLSGYKGLIELGYHVKTGTYGMDRISLNIINGYQFNPHLSIGFGTGLRYYMNSDAALLPLFTDIRAYFLNSSVSPYFSTGFGYTFDLTNKFEPVGLLLSPSLGASFKVNEKSAINIGLGYEMQKMKFLTLYRNYWNYYTREFVENSGAITIHLGMSF